MYNLSSIKAMHLELSSRCNASCPVCSRNFSGGPKVDGLEEVDLTLNDIKSFVDNNILKNIERINYCGNLGDPGMNKELLDILVFFKQNASKNLIQTVRTNGGMRNEPYWQSLAEFFNDNEHKSASIFSKSGIVFSVDGLEDTNHIYRRGVTWEKVWNNMVTYSRSGGIGYWEFLIFEHNQHQVEEARQRANDLGFEFILKNPVGFGDDEHIIKPIKCIDKDGNFQYNIYPAHYDGDRISHNTNIDFKNFHSIPILSEKSKNLCNETKVKCKSTHRSEDQEIFISASGHLFPCCFLGGILGQKNSSYSRYQFINELSKIGGLDFINLKNRSISEILTDFKFISFFDDAFNAPDIESGRLLWCSEICGEKSSIDQIYKYVKLRRDE